MTGARKEAPMKTANQESTQTQKRSAYRIDEVAELLGVSKSTVYRAVAAGQLRAIKLSKNTYVIPVCAFNALLGMDTAD